MYALKRFHTFIDRLPFTIVTDCEALSQTFEKKETNKRIARWVMALQEYDFKIQHRKGSSMTHVDALSRIAMTGAIETDEIDLDMNG